MVHGVRRRPGIAVVAVLADICRLQVRYGLTSSFHSVVTAHAVADDADMVEVGRPPGIGRVAVITGIAAVDMGRVLARGRDAVVARTACSKDLSVIDHENRREDVGVMAVLAYVRGLNVRLVLARGLDTVVAIDAVAGDAHMIEIRWYPTGRCVAVVTGIATCNVIWRLPGCREAVMTGATGSGYLGMVDDVHRRKRIRVVAVFTYVGCCYVSWVFSGCIRAVVAARTTSRDIDVVEVGGYPARGRMTIVAGVAAVQVSRVLASRGDTVMTRAAGANDLGVIDSKHGRENVSRVAVLAYVAGLDVCKVFSGSFGAVMAADAIAADIHVVKIGGQPADR